MGSISPKPDALNRTSSRPEVTVLHDGEEHEYPYPLAFSPHHRKAWSRSLGPLGQSQTTDRHAAEPALGPPLRTPLPSPPTRARLTQSLWSLQTREWSKGDLGSVRPASQTVSPSGYMFHMVHMEISGIGVLHRIVHRPVPQPTGPGATAVPSQGPAHLTHSLTRTCTHMHAHARTS